MKHPVQQRMAMSVQSHPEEKRSSAHRRQHQPRRRCNLENNSCLSKTADTWTRGSLAAITTGDPCVLLSQQTHVDSSLTQLLTTITRPPPQSLRDCTIFLILSLSVCTRSIHHDDDHHRHAHSCSLYLFIRNCCHLYTHHQSHHHH